MVVPPILKKFAPSSPKNSLDLDRGWEEQPADFGGYASTTHEPGRPSLSRSVRDVSFQMPLTWEPSTYGSGGSGLGLLGVGGIIGGGAAANDGRVSGPGSGTATPVHGGAGGLEPITTSPLIGGINGVSTSSGRTNLGRPGARYHVRSTSGTSYVSISTGGSSHRPPFVHPFQQTPRTNTPPLTYAHSFTSFERDTYPARDYSPTIITENEDDDDFDSLNPASLPLLSQSATSAGGHHHSLHRKSASTGHTHTHSHSPSAASLQRPSSASQRTSSLSDISGRQSTSSSSTQQPSLRLNTTSSATTNSTSHPSSIPRSVPNTSFKPNHGHLNTAYSNSDLALHSSSPTDSPRPSIHLATTASPTLPHNPTATMSPLRTSLEGAFRLRSRSEVDTGASSRVDIREARRQFEEAERIKQEKYEAEQRRKQERKLEKEKALMQRKNTGSEMSSVSVGGARPSFSRKRSPQHDARREMSEKTLDHQQQQPGATAFMSSNYESTEGGAAPAFGLDVHDVRFETPQRAHTTKRKTQSYWTSFVLWFRTRLLRLGRH